MEIDYKAVYIKASAADDVEYEKYARAVSTKDHIEIDKAKKSLGKSIYASDVAYLEYLRDYRRKHPTWR